MKHDATLLSVDKKLTSLADILCDVTKQRGVTEVRVIDHSLRPQAGIAASNRNDNI